MKLIYIIFLAAALLCGCNTKQDAINRISSQGTVAESVYLTHDRQSNPVIAWTERNGTDVKFVYAISADDGRSFTARTAVPLDATVATHAEGMPKIAFKNDGSIIIAYEKKTPTKENEYAGAICYRTSTDNGNSWTKERYLHSDTVPGRSRSYFDIETLPDGEVGASWLDIKLDASTGGRSVRFAKTNLKNEFANELLVDSSACQCCRTEVYADAGGNINVAYRGMKNGTMGKIIRDMMISASTDNGITFTQPLRISADNWNIDGCPHTGPALCGSRGSLQALWYTGGGGAGIYYAHRNDGEKDFDSRQLISNFGRHPQASSNDKSVALVWEETIGDGDKQVTQIQYQINNGQAVMRAGLTPDNTNAYLPVITPTTSGFLVAFFMEQNGEAGLYVKQL